MLRLEVPPIFRFPLQQVKIQVPREEFAVERARKELFMCKKRPSYFFLGRNFMSICESEHIRSYPQERVRKGPTAIPDAASYPIIDEEMIVAYE